MRSGIHALALITFALVGVLALPARAQDMQVDRLEVVESGFYDTAKTTVTGAAPAAGAVAGSVQEVREVTLLAESPATTARVGIGFGVRSRSYGARDGERAMLRAVWKIPPPGIVNPSNGSTFHESVADFTTRIGTSHMRGYSFDEAWEVVPGTWTVEIWQGDRKLLEKSFEIK